MATKVAPTKRVLTPTALADKLARAAGGSSHSVVIPLSAVATAVALLGSPTELREQYYSNLAANPDRLHVLYQFWKTMTIEVPYLQGHLQALFSWADNPSEEDGLALQRCLEVVASIDFYGTVTQPQVDGEILGPLYQMLTHSSAKAAKGAFYTPMSLCMMIATMTETKDFDSVSDPCVGAGAMAVAVAKVMRKAGRHPETVRWHLVDIDPIAVALAGINSVVHGFGPNVTLICGDSLAPGMV